MYPIYTAQNVHFGWNEKVIGFVQSLKYYDSIVKKEAEKGIAAYSFSASFIYTSSEYELKRGKTKWN